jgi:hypothetical protein
MCFKRNITAGSKDGKENAKMSTREEFIRDIRVTQTARKLDGPLFNELLKIFTNKAAKRKTHSLTERLPVSFFQHAFFFFFFFANHEDRKFLYVHI